MMSLVSVSRQQIQEIYDLPLIELLHRAIDIHRKNQDTGHMQVCSLLSVKTGACPEDCGYCPQSSHYKTGLQAHGLLEIDQVIAAAEKAKQQGAERFCMGAAWREIKDNAQFEQVLEMVGEVASLGMEVCCTMGMLSATQATRLKQAGLTAYNHNLDSGPEFYNQVISTRSYQERLDTIKNVADAGISVCCGGILGMGESHSDRIDLIEQLLRLPKAPESIPINTLVAVEGTPLQDQPKIEFWEILRMIASVRIFFPKSRIRLSAGRLFLSEVEQTLCFLVGANSVFAGDKLLTTTNNEVSADQKLFGLLGLRTGDAGSDPFNHIE